jgi:hypothetical protein
MSFEEHSKECHDKLGEKYEDVHRWLDEYACSAKYGMRHRRARHHQAGIGEARSHSGRTQQQRLVCVSSLGA